MVSFFLKSDYLREFINSKENIYKIGKTKQINFKRFGQYPKGTIILFQSICLDCNNAEKELIALFKLKYELCKNIGNEYFKGSYKLMVNDICNYINSEKTNINTEEFINSEKTNINTEKTNINTEEFINSEKTKTNINIEKTNINTEKTNINTEKTKSSGKICIKCNKIFDAPCRLKAHLNRKSTCELVILSDDTDNKFKCKFCNKSFVTNISMYRHIRLYCKIKLTSINKEKIFN